MLSPQSRQEDFPSLADRVYLNTAAEGIPSPPALAALAQYARDKVLGMDGRRLHEAHWREARERAATLLGLTAGEVALCSCSSEAYNLAAAALHLEEGDEVVVNDLDFPAAATPWMQPGCRATVRVWRARQGALRVEDVVPLLGLRTRFVSVSLVSFYNGFRVSVPAVAEAVGRCSPALLGVDATQALGRIPLDLRGADLVISSTHKWILGSHGGGLVGMPRGRWQEWTAPAGGWFNLQDPFRADRFEGPARSKPGPESFMVGMPNYPAAYAVGAALGYIQSVGVERIAAHADPLVRQCLDGLRQLPVQVITPDEPGALAGIVSFLHPQAERIHEHLHARDIHVMCHAGRLRVSVHGYNTADDVDHFLRSLAEALRKV
ncbi:MAG: aminotransferase class V-fold PLP-dependent enzyme [Candidatus Latescibacterota bacterium]